VTSEAKIGPLIMRFTRLHFESEKADHPGITVGLDLDTRIPTRVARTYGDVKGRRCSRMTNKIRRRRE
jgi:hypothetical protein